MSETTSKLSLFKYNTTADAKQPFSIKDCMNDNWDKLDAFATSVDTIFSSSFSSNLDKKVFSDINKELGKKLEADVLLAENGYIKFNNGIIINLISLPANSNGVTIQFPMAYKQKCFAFSCQYYSSAHNVSAFVVYISNLTLTSCLVTNYQGIVSGCVMLIGK